MHERLVGTRHINVLAYFVEIYLAEVFSCK